MIIGTILHVLKTGLVSDSYCRWTAWLNSDSGGAADKELLSALVGKYGAYACTKPSQIKVRRVSDKQNATMKYGPQTYSFLDTTSGFQCLTSMQSDGSACFDYEVQLCCPRKLLFYLNRGSCTNDVTQILPRISSCKNFFLVMPQTVFNLI